MKPKYRHHIDPDTLLHIQLSNGVSAMSQVYQYLLKHQEATTKKIIHDLYYIPVRSVNVAIHKLHRLGIVTKPKRAVNCIAVKQQVATV